MSENLGHFNATVESSIEASEMASQRLEVTSKLVGHRKEGLLDNKETVKSDLEAARSDIIAAKREVEAAMQEYEELVEGAESE